MKVGGSYHIFREGRMEWLKAQKVDNTPGGVKPLQPEKSFAGGFKMRLTDRPDNPENTIISVEPWLNKDGAPQLKMTVYQAAGSVQRAQANEQAVEWAGRPEAVLC